MITVSICSPSQSDAGPWQDLLRRSSSNVFMDPAALEAAAVTNFADIKMLLAWEQGTEPPRLVGVWGLQIRRIVPFWPALLEALPCNYAFLSSPVVDPLFVAEVIPAFFATIAGSALPKVLRLRDFNAESPNYTAVVQALAALGRAPLKLAEAVRPVVTREFGVKRSGSTRKKLRQDWRRLSAQGHVDMVNDRRPEAVRQAFETFLAMEAAGWKGTRGTAVLSDARDTAFVRRLVGDLAADGNASVALLRIDGRAIAAQVLMYGGSTAYTWKTAYDASFARFSPGALLVDKVTEELFATPGIDAIDSCSDGNGFMAQLWAGRRIVVDLLIDLSPRRTLGFMLEAARQRGYYRLRVLRNQLRAGGWLPAR